MKFRLEQFGEHFTLEKGIGYKGEDLVESSDVGLVTLDSFRPGGGYKWSSEKPFAGDFKQSFVLAPGDVVVATTDVTQDGSVLCASALIPDYGDSFSELVWSLDVARLEPTTGAIRPEFVYNFLRVSLNRRRAAYGDSGTTVRRIPFDAMYEQLIPRPSIDEQDRINRFIADIDRQENLHVEMSRSLIRVVETQFRKQFVERCLGVSDLNGLDAPDEWVVPSNWKLDSLRDYLTTLETGKRPAGGVKGIVTGIPSIGAESINGIGAFDFGKTKFVPEEFVAKMKRGIPEDFDVLLYKDGGKPGEFKPKIGMFGVGYPFERFVLNEHVFMLRAPELGQAYLYMWIAQQGMMNRLAEMGAKAAVPGINQEHVQSLKIAVPPKQELKSFDDFAMPLIRASLELMTSTIVFSQIRDEVLPRLVDGRLRLSEIQD